MIVAGALLAIIGFFGCYGALRENKCLLTLVGDANLCLYPIFIQFIL